jgi:hypothetical protein
MKKLFARLTTLAMTAGLLVFPVLASGVQRISERLSLSTDSKHDFGRNLNQGNNNACRPVYRPKKPCNTSLTVTVTTTTTLSVAGV